MGETILVVVFLCLACCAALVLDLRAGLTRREECHGAIITAIGGCDRGAFCGVMLSDGTTGHARYPVIGRPCE